MWLPRSAKINAASFDGVVRSLLLSQVFRGNFPKMSAFVIDAFEFCRTAGVREGVTPVTEMPRLAGECADASGEIRWHVAGGSTKQGYPSLTLTVQGQVKLMCQRCLQPFAYDMDSSTVLVLGKDDEDADHIEGILDDESIDVIVGSRTCDLRQLYEDEALLALPQSPRHEECPENGLLEHVADDKVSPFAALNKLKVD